MTGYGGDRSNITLKGVYVTRRAGEGDIDPWSVIFDLFPHGRSLFFISYPPHLIGLRNFQSFHFQFRIVIKPFWKECYCSLNSIFHVLREWMFIQPRIQYIFFSAGMIDHDRYMSRGHILLYVPGTYSNMMYEGHIAKCEL